MDGITIESTPTTPYIKFDIKAGKLDIIGRSIEENSVEFYKPLMDYIDKYAKSPAPVTEVNIQLEYFNTSSSRGLIEVLKKLNNIFKQGHKTVINWHYEEDDEEIKEAGLDFVNLVEIPFNMCPTTE